MLERTSLMWLQNICIAQVAACSDVAIVLGESSLVATTGKQLTLYIGYDNLYSSVLAPDSNKNYM